MRVAVVGGSGYAGGEVLRLLLGHPDVEIGSITANTAAGGTVGAHHPHLVPLAHRTFEPTSPAVLSGHDVVFLALPHGQSAAVAAAVPDDVLVVDLGADHRLIDPDAWDQFYGVPHAGTWPYGMPELPIGTGLQRAELDGARRIAVPGCNATAVTLALAPGVAAGLVRADDTVAVLACAPSGAGRTLAAYLLASEILGSAAPYGVGGKHRHIPEIEQNLHAAGAATVGISFTPTLVPMSRGILATVTAPVQPDVDPRGQTRTSTSRSSTCCPKASGRPRRAPWDRTPRTSRLRSTSGPDGSSRSVRSTTSARAPPARLCNASTSRSVCQRPPGWRSRGRRRERDSRAGIPGFWRPRRAALDRCT
jgi:N-acetyl-gamma-glutamyl-phosphate reductase